MKHIKHKTIIRFPRQLVFAVIAVLVVVGGALVFWSTKQSQVSAAWFDDSFAYRQSINVTVASSASDVTNLETLLTINTSALISAGKLQSSCQDLRFLSQNNKSLPYYIASGCNTTTTKVWVLVDSVPKNTTTYSLFMYYGNSTAPAKTDATTLFRVAGLVGYWTMNETSWNGTSGEVKDSSPNGYNGTGTGGITTTASGKYAYGGNFDGNNDYVSVPTFTISGNQTTFSAWVNPTDFATYRDLVKNVGNPGTGNYYLYINPGSGTIHAAFAGDTLDTVAGLTAGVWTHVVATYDGANIKMYFNGALVTTQASGGPSFSFTGINIGAQSDGGSERFYGPMDDVRIYNRAFSASEVSNLYADPGQIASFATTISNPTTTFNTEEKSQGPVAYWDFNEGTGTVAKDRSVNGKTGTLNAMASPPTGSSGWQTEDKCISGKCVAFDGTNDYVSLTSDIRSGDSAGTLVAWVKFSGNGSANNVNPIMSLGGSSGSTVFALRRWESSANCGSGRLELRVYNGGAVNNDVCGTSVLADNVWYQVAMVSDSSSYTMFINGKPEALNIVTGSNNGDWISDVGASSSVADFGRLYFQGSPFSYGKSFIDEPKIYNYARSADQIKADYNNRISEMKGTSAVLGADSANALNNGLVGYWKMDESSWNGTAGEVRDASGNGNNGAAVANATTTGARFGSGGTFDGTGDYVGVGSTNFPSTTGTISFWMKASAWSGYSDVINFQPNAGANNANRITFERNNAYSSVNGCGGLANNIDFALSDGTGSSVPGLNTLCSTTSISTATWYHIVGTWTSTQRSIYVNGVLESSATGLLVPAIAPTRNGIGGSADWSGRDFNGIVDEARVYNRSLSAAEIQQLYNFAPGPVAYYNFEEGQGSTVADSSTYANNGTWSGTAPYWANGKIGKAGVFNGSNTYLPIAATPIVKGNMTVDFWFKPNTISGTTGILETSSGGTQDSTPYIYILNDAGTLKVYSEDQKYASLTTLTVGQWYHVAITRSATTEVGYVNGVQVLSRSHTTGGSDVAMNIGVGYHGYFSGQVDDFKVYNYPRSAAQIVDDMKGSGALVSNLGGGNRQGTTVGYWDFDQGTGTVANDGSGNRNNGTLTNMSSPATPVSGWNQNGKLNKALSFDGINDTVEVNTSAGAISGDQVSVSIWVKADRISDDAGVIGKTSTTAWNNGYGIYTDTTSGNNTLRFFINAYSTNVAISPTITSGTWYHVVGTYDGATIKIYLNGILGTTDTLTGNITDGGTLEFGTLGGWTNEFSGVLDEAKIYNYALTADEVKTEFNQMKSVVLGSFSDTSQLSGGSVASNSASAINCVPGDSASCAPPVAEWNFEEGTGSTVSDTTGNANTGTWNGTAPYWAQGKQGWGGKFNGSNSYITTSSYSESANQAFSANLWFYPTSNLTSPTGLFSHKQNSVSGWFIAAANTTQNKPAFFTTTGTYLVSSTAYNLNKWNHIEVTFSGGARSLYLNGVLVASDTGAAFGANNIPFTIGRYHSDENTGYFPGTIDRIQYFNYARSAAQVAWDYNKGKPVSRWDFDECQGTVLNDSLGSLLGTITIGASGSQTTPGTCQANSSATAWWNGRVGKFNSSLNFDGTDDYVSLGTNTIGSRLNGSSALVTSTWVNYSSLDSSQYDNVVLVGRVGSATNANIWLNIRGDGANAGKVLFGGRSQNADTFQEITSNRTLSAGTWYHIVGVEDFLTGRLSIYINGTLDKSSTVTFGSTSYVNSGTPTQPDSISSTSYVVTYPFAGQIDDTRIYNYVVTPVLVKQMYNEGYGVRFGPTSGTP